MLSAKVGLWGAYSEGGTGATFADARADPRLRRGDRLVEHGPARHRVDHARRRLQPRPRQRRSTNIGIDPRWQNWTATGLVQGWVDNPTSNKGVLFRLANETHTDPAGAVHLRRGRRTSAQRPRLEVVYTAPATENTYYAPTVPSRMIPGDEYAVAGHHHQHDQLDLAKADWVLSYRWELADGTDVTTPDNQRETPLPADLPPGAVATVEREDHDAGPHGPGQQARRRSCSSGTCATRPPGSGCRRCGRSRRWRSGSPSRTRPPTSSAWRSSTSTPARTPAPARTVMVNQFSGNAVFSYNAFSNPSRGAVHVRPAVLQQPGQLQLVRRLRLVAVHVHACRGWARRWSSPAATPAGPRRSR